MAAIDSIGTMIPDITLDNVILQKENGVTYARLKMSMQEFLYSSDSGTWITDNNMQNHIVVDITVTTDIGTQTVSRTLDDLTTTREVNQSKTGTLQRIGKETSIYGDDSFSNIFLGNEFDLFGTGTDDNKTLTISAKTRLLTNSLDDFSWGNVVPFTIYGKESTVSVVINGEPQTRTTGYFLGGAFYTGPKTQLENGRWVTGNSQNANSEFLIERDVPNIRVFDSRDIFDLASGGLSFLGAQPAAGQTCQELDESKAVFSHIDATRDRDNLLRYVFTLDYNEAYRQNSVYLGLYDSFSDRLRDRILRMSKLRKLTVSRERTDVQDSAMEFVISSGELSGDRFIDTTDTDGSIKEEEFSFQKGTLFFRTFSGTDKRFKEITAGKYKFNVDAQIEDGIFKFLRFQETDLVEAQKAFASYIARAQEAEDTDEFFQQINSEYDFLNRPNIRALVSLSENVYFLPFAGDCPDEDTIKRVINSFRHYLSPITSTIGNMNSLEPLFQKMIEMIQVYKTLISQATQALSTTDDPNEVSRGNLLYNISHEFSNTFNALENHKTGIYFMSMKKAADAKKTMGLRKMTSKNFEARIKNELDNFFNGQSLNFTITSGGTSNVTAVGATTSYSYLTPSSVRIGNTFYTVGSNTGLPADDNTEFDSLLSGDSTQKYRRVLAELRNAKTSDAGFGEQMNLDVKPLADGEYESIYPIGTTEPEAEGQTTLSIEEFTQLLDGGGFDNPFDALKVISVDVTDGETTLKIQGLDGKTHELTQSDFDKEVPNYFKAILAASPPLGDRYAEIFDAATVGNLAPYSLLFGSMAKLEYLRGFDGGVNNPTFKTLTKNAYERNAGSTLLCRISKYQGGKIGFIRSNDAPIYNHYFVLECPPSTRSLQDDLNAATTIFDISQILDDISGDGEVGDINTDLCNALADAQAIEAMAGFLAETPPPLTLLPLLTGEEAPFDGILMESEAADKIINERDSLAEELETLKGEVE